MKRIFYTLLVLALLAVGSVLLAPRLLARRIVVSIAQVAITLGDASGNPLGLQLNPFALTQSLDSFGDLYFTAFITLEIENHNPIPFDLVSVEYAAELSTVEPISTQDGTVERRVELPANGIEQVEIVMQLPVGDLYSSLGELAALRRANLEVSGELVLDQWVGSQRVAFEHERMVGLPAIELPTLPSLPDLPDFPDIVVPSVF